MHRLGLGLGFELMLGLGLGLGTGVTQSSAGCVQKVYQLLIFGDVARS